MMYAPQTTPTVGTVYPEVTGQIVAVEKVFRLFLRVSVKWRGRMWGANINRMKHYTPTLTAPVFYDQINRDDYELSQYFTVGDMFRIDEVVGCDFQRAGAHFNVSSCECTQMKERVENEMGIIFSNFGDAIGQSFFGVRGPDRAIAGGQKKVFICCEALDRKLMSEHFKYDSYQCIAFESHFVQHDVDKYGEAQEEYDYTIEDEEEVQHGPAYRARRGEFVKLDAVYPKDRRFPLVARARVLEKDELEICRLPSLEDGSVQNQFMRLCQNLVFYQSELDKFSTKKLKLNQIVPMEVTRHLGGDHLPLEGSFQYTLPGKDDRAFLKPVVGTDLHFTMFLDEKLESRKEFVGTVESADIMPENQMFVKISFRSRTAVDLILSNVPRRKNYGVQVRQRFNGGIYKLQLRLLKKECADCLKPSRLKSEQPPEGRNKILQMLVCCLKENPKVDKDIPAEPIRTPGLVPMDQPSQLMAVRAVFGEKRCLTCIEGPWGTGKTLSTVSILYRWVQENPDKTFMVCAQTNLIVDYITMGLADAQKELESRGDDSVRICRSYANQQTANRGSEYIKDYTPWMLAEEPDPRESDEMKDLRRKIEKRTEELNAIEVTVEDRSTAVKNVKIKQMACLIRLIERVYKPKLRMLWLIELNPNIILCTINHALVFHYGVELDDEDELMKKLKQVYKKLYPDAAEEVSGDQAEDEDDLSDEEELKDVEEDEEVPLNPDRRVDPVEIKFNNICSRRYRGIICDESGQILQHVAMDLSLLLDQSDPNVQMVFVGDRFQLGPHVMAVCGGEAQKLLELSILEILVDRKVCAFVQLCETFRAHPAIVEFLKEQIYGGELDLQNRVDPRQRQILIRTPKISNLLPRIEGDAIPVLFFNYDYPEEMGAGKSMFNVLEAYMAIIMVEYLVYKNHIPLNDILVLTMYESQNRQVRQMLVNTPFRLRDDDLHRSVDVRNVDGSQGQERDIVILLTTRCNQSEKIGFLKNKRRANVALSRGRHGLIIFGNVHTLSSDQEFWGRLVEKYIADGSVYNILPNANFEKFESISVKKMSTHGRVNPTIFLPVK